MEKLQKACEEADKAFKLSKEERVNLLVDYNDVPLSDDEKKQEPSPGTDKENDDNFCDPPTKRRKIFVFDSEDSEDEYKPEKVEESDDDVSSEANSDSEEVKTEPENEEETPPRGVKRKRNQPVKSNKKNSALKFTPINSPKPSFSSSVSSSAKAKLSLFKNVSVAVNFFFFFFFFLEKI